MKKLTGSVFAFFLSALFAFGQETGKAKADFLIFSGGPSFPFGNFASTNVDNEDPGMAKTGYTIEFKLGHHFDQVFGFQAAALYGRHAVDKTIAGGVSGVDVKPWQYYGILAGPMITGNISPKTNVDFSVLTGATLANSPKVTVSTSLLMEGDWAVTVPLKIASDLRYTFTRNGFVFLGASYLYMRPHFKANVEGEYTAFKQRMSVLGINAGLGFAF